MLSLLLKLDKRSIFDKRRRVPGLKAGDKVMVHRDFLITPEARDRPCDKVRPRWYGPFEIKEQVGTNAFRLELPGIRAPCFRLL